MASVEDVIFGEELKANALLKKAKTDVPKIIAKMGISGETLALMHHTHGYDPETVASIVEIPPKLMTEYNLAIAAEKSRSRHAQTRQMITALA